MKEITHIKDIQSTNYKHYLYINRRGQSFIKTGRKIVSMFYGTSNAHKNDFMVGKTCFLLENRQEKENVRYMIELTGDYRG